MADLPQRNNNFTFLLIDSYSMNSVADQVNDLPHRIDNFTFLIIDSSSESSHVADQVADLNPLEMVILDSYL